MGDKKPPPVMESAANQIQRPGMGRAKALPLTQEQRDSLRMPGTRPTRGVQCVAGGGRGVTSLNLGQALESEAARGVSPERQELEIGSGIAIQPGAGVSNTSDSTLSSQASESRPLESGLAANILVTSNDKDQTDCEQVFMAITGCAEGRAKVMLAAVGGDLQNALNLHWDRKEEEVGVKEEVGVEKEVRTEEEELSRVVEASISDHRSKEPSVEDMFKLLQLNYSQKDPVTMKKLCIEHEGNSAELEKYLHNNFEDIPTVQQEAIRKMKAHLEDKVVMLQQAGVEGLQVDSCPSCLAPRIMEDPASSVFCCISPGCGLEYCRKCWQQQHQPKPCAVVREEDMGPTASPLTKEVDFEVINILPKRQFDDKDPMEIEYRRAESQFLRMQAKGINTGCTIQSIDVVTNRTLQERFEAKQAELLKKNFCDCLLLFHGTPQKNVESILRNNFDTSIVAHGRTYGNGVYFSERPEVSLGYSNKQQLILCKVLPGDNSTEHNPQGKEGEGCWAIVVPDVDQILPKYVINFI